ncbi:helix-turn-helix domain-containing protein [Chromobacterium vaccinii]|uniref:helix-turn-helix domain-containing protein n=1 Tax=Chromobacterium vaccinii TaxID=1108595 RepID=UPI003C7319D6
MSNENLNDEFPARAAEAISLAGGPTEASKKTGVTLATLARWKNGEADPSRSNLIRLAAAANVNLQWLATGSGAKQVGSEERQASAPTPGPVSDEDAVLIALCVRSLEEWLQEKNLILRPIYKGEAVSLLFKYLKIKESYGKEDINAFLGAIASRAA